MSLNMHCDGIQNDSVVQYFLENNGTVTVFGTIFGTAGKKENNVSKACNSDGIWNDSELGENIENNVS